MMMNIRFKDNPVVITDRDKYADITVDAARVLESWRLSLMSFEWLDFEGRLKALESMPETERNKRLRVEKQMKEDEALITPVLGIGIQDNIEIGSGRAEFLTLAVNGVKKIPVHVRQSQIKDFKPFLAGINWES